MKKVVTAVLAVAICLSMSACKENQTLYSSNITNTEGTSSNIGSQQNNESSSEKNNSQSTTSQSVASQNVDSKDNSSKVSSTVSQGVTSNTVSLAPTPTLGISAEKRVPANCSYKTAKGILYPAGSVFPNEVCEGDIFTDGHYEYKYNYVFDDTINEDEWHKIEAYATGWVVLAIDRTRETYPEMYSAINGKPVTNIYQTFMECTNLKKAPRLSQNAINLNFAFSYCSNLESIDYIPHGAVIMSGAFSYCSKLKSIPDIPPKVKDMTCTFMGCTSLKSIGVVPASVEYLELAFEGCTSLGGKITINANAPFYENMFKNTKKNIILTGTSDYLFDYMRTATNNNIEVQF